MKEVNSVTFNHDEALHKSIRLMPDQRSHYNFGRAGHLTDTTLQTTTLCLVRVDVCSNCSAKSCFSAERCLPSFRT